MSEQTYHTTKQDVAKQMQQEAKAHGGNIPSDSQAAGLQHIVDANAKNKAQEIEERKANLPLPDQPPGKTDFQSANAETVNVGSGGVSSDFSRGGGAASSGLREPASGASAVRESGDEWKQNTAGLNVGRTAVEGLNQPPSDAVASGKQGSTGVDETRK